MSLEFEWIKPQKYKLIIFTQNLDGIKDVISKANKIEEAQWTDNKCVIVNGLTLDNILQLIKSEKYTKIIIEKEAEK